MRLHKALFFATILILLIGVFLGLNYKSKIPKLNLSDEKLNEFRTSTSLAFVELSELEVPTFESLCKKSSLIIIVEPTEDREISKGGYIVSQVTVESIIKGNKSVNHNQKIYVYENSKINYFEWDNSPETLTLNNDLILLTGVTNILQTGKQYLIFLKELDMSPYYKFTEKESNSYMYADKNYSQFPVKMNNYIVLDPEKTYQYKDLIDYDCISPSEELYQKYKSLYEKVHATGWMGSISVIRFW